MADLRLVYSPVAVRDIQDIYVYIAADSLKHASKTVELITNLCEDLRASPGMGHRREDLDGKDFDVRSIAHASHFIFYTANEEELKVVRVLHGARNVSPDQFKDIENPKS